MRKLSDPMDLCTFCISHTKAEIKASVKLQNPKKKDSARIELESEAHSKMQTATFANWYTSTTERLCLQKPIDPLDADLHYL